MGEFILKYWVQVLFSGMLTLLGLIVKGFKEQRKEQENIKAGVQALLRDRLIQTYNHYSEQGYCTIKDRDNFMNMYDRYHHLGENGVVDDLVEKLKDLPFRCEK